MELIIPALGLVVSFYLLARICDLFFVESLEIIAEKLKMSSDVAGATLMAIGSSAPEFFTALIALFIAGGGYENVGSGTIVGSAIFNLLVIVGAASLFRENKLNWQPVTRDLLFYFVSVVLLFFIFIDGKITMTESIIFLIFYILYLFSFKVWKKLFPYRSQGGDIEEIFKEEESEFIKETKRENWYNPFHILDKFVIFIFPNLKKRPNLYMYVFVLSIAFIIFLSWLLVDSGINFAQVLGIPPVLIALTVLAAGTSVPDLLSSVIVAKRGKGDMAVSNAIGSNIFDIQICLGLTWAIAMVVRGGFISVSTENIVSSIILLVVSIIYLAIALIIRKWRIGRTFGVIFIGTYILYIIAVYNGWLS